MSAPLYEPPEESRRRAEEAAAREAASAAQRAVPGPIPGTHEPRPEVAPGVPLDSLGHSGAPRH